MVPHCPSVPLDLLVQQIEGNRVTSGKPIYICCCTKISSSNRSLFFETLGEESSLNIEFSVCYYYKTYVAQYWAAINGGESKRDRATFDVCVGGNREDCNEKSEHMAERDTMHCLISVGVLVTMRASFARLHVCKFYGLAAVHYAQAQQSLVIDFKHNLHYA